MLWLSFTKVSFITRGDGEFWPRGDFVLLHGDFIREVEDEEFYGPSFVGFVVVTMIKKNMYIYGWDSCLSDNFIGIFCMSNLMNLSFA